MKWRKPTENEAAMIFEEERDRANKERLLTIVIMVILALMSLFFLRAGELGIVFLICAEMIIAAFIVIYLAVSIQYMNTISDQEYEVVEGVFEKKRIRLVSKNNIRYFLVARFEDGSTEEAQTDKHYYDYAEDGSIILVLAFPYKTHKPLNMRAFVIHRRAESSAE